MSDTPYVITIAVLLLVLMAVVTFSLDAYHRRVGCRNDPTLWCYKDWQCGGPDGFSNPVNRVNEILNKCKGDGSSGAPNPNCPCPNKLFEYDFIDETTGTRRSDLTAENICPVPVS